jgi:hypothetical protein
MVLAWIERIIYCTYYTLWVLAHWKIPGFCKLEFVSFVIQTISSWQDNLISWCCRILVLNNVWFPPNSYFLDIPWNHWKEHEKLGEQLLIFDHVFKLRSCLQHLERTITPTLEEVSIITDASENMYESRLQGQKPIDSPVLSFFLSSLQHTSTAKSSKQSSKRQ